jgi:hypothetical protein
VNDWWVLDNRNGNSQGPYAEKDAKRLAKDLSEFVLRNDFPALAGATVVGPFTAVSTEILQRIRTHERVEKWAARRR